MWDAKKCPECGGQGVSFKGSGKNTQYMICPRWQEPGHPSEAEIQAAIRDVRRAAMPSSGRFG